MSGLRRRFRVALLAACCALGSCSGDDAATPPRPTPTEVPAEDAAPTTTAAPTVTTTTVPVADRLPPLATDVSGAVRAEDGTLRAIDDTDGVSWFVTGPCGGTEEFDAAQAPVIGPQHVVIDPGHGGEDAGVEGVDGIDEASLNLDVAQRVATILRTHGVAVVLTRDRDAALSSDARAKAADAVGAGAVISVHHRTGGAPSSEPGTEAWYPVADEESRRLAGLVYEQLVAALDPLVDQWWAPAEPGVKYLLNQRGSDFFDILREREGPSVLVEVGSLDNPSEAAVLTSEVGRQAEAEALADAVIRFLVDGDAEGRGFIEPAERVRTADPTGEADCG